jgi:hypothetical protein
MTIIHVPKAKQVRNPYLWTVLLYPDICTHLTVDLLVNTPRESRLGQLVWHRNPEDNAFRRVARRNLDKNAKVEATADPSLPRQDCASILWSQPKVMSDDGGDRISLFPQVFE